MKYIAQTLDPDNSNIRVTMKIELKYMKENQHSDFSVTYEMHEKIKNHWRVCSFGSSTETLLKYFPEFKDFILLHGSDYEGTPMYPVDNGFYHLHNSSKKDTIEYLRLIDKEYFELKSCIDKISYTLMLGELGIVKRWKAEAKNAIERLEKLTGEKHENISTRSHLTWHEKKK